jgi:methylmalonyl-CoA/ethylmalonyl-CoA epimerase
MRLHHIGKVVKDLEEARKYYEDTFGLKALGPPVIDPIQAVEVVFIETGPGGSPSIELICPIEEASPVSEFLRNGGGLHHLCFEVEDVSKSIVDLKEKGSILLSKPVPGKGHGNRMTAWVYTASRELVELLEVKAD